MKVTVYTNGGRASFTFPSMKKMYEVLKMTPYAAKRLVELGHIKIEKHDSTN